MNNIQNNNFIKEINWVWVVIEIQNNIESTKWEILFLIENMEKEWKKPGQISIPFWTTEYWELPIDTATREIEEEAWFKVDKSLLKEKWKFVMYIDSEKWKIKANIYIFHILLNSRPDIKINNPDEIRKVSFHNIDKLNDYEINDIRPWTIESIYWYNKDEYNWIVYIQDWVYDKNYTKLIKSELIK